MGDYFPVNPLSADVDSSRTNGNASPSDAKRFNGNWTTAANSAQTQPRHFYPNNNLSSLTWDISLTNDHDEVSERFLGMHVTQTSAVAEKFGPVLMTVAENIKKQADELFKPSEIDPNEMYDLVDTKVSWILPSCYQQYLKSVPANVLENGETHVLYPWTQRNTSAGSGRRPPLNRVESLPAAFDRLSLSSSRSPYGASPNNNNSDGGGSNSNSATGDFSSFAYGAGSRFPPPQQNEEPRAVRRRSSTSECGASSSSDSDRSPSRPFAAATSGFCWPSRLYYRVYTEGNVLSKLVTHYCTFCYKNREPPEVYGSHLVQDSTRTTCPKLRALKCKHCNGTGDNAHTIKYCPYLYSNYS